MSVTTQKLGQLVLILAKAPIPTHGRVGRPVEQDWYRTIELAVGLLRVDPRATILLVTAFSTPDEGKELTYYKNVLQSIFGVSTDRIIGIEQGTETISQLAAASAYGSEHKRNLTIICTPIHSLRVKYLCWKDDIKANILVAQHGWPRPREAVTDAILTFAFPLIDLFGQRQWFLNKVGARRASGQL